MFSARDSLYNIRTARKRESPGTATTSFLPVDELRSLARKRQRTDIQSSVSLSHPITTTLDPKKSVNFDLAKNTYEESSLCTEDVHQAWLTSEESQQIKNELRVTVLAVQHGLINPEDVCMRGLEAHADLELSSAKRKKGKDFVTRIIQQQSLLKAMMGRVNEHILAKLSVVLSAEDAMQAKEFGAQDAYVAKLIHSERVEAKSEMDIAITYISVVSLLREGLAGMADSELISHS
ncbi:hypothetical protein ACA910_021883 [Epithemia clementina (nom. ined.)]